MVSTARFQRARCDDGPRNPARLAFFAVMVKHIGDGGFVPGKGNRRITYSESAWSPVVSLGRLRLEAARGLLSETSRPVTEIAFEVGFNSSQYFSTVFLQYTGLTPSGFRSRGVGSES